MTSRSEGGGQGGDEPEIELNDEMCQKIVEQFVALTETNEALAQFYLQERAWKLETSVNDYFLDLEQTESSSTQSERKRPAAVAALEEDTDEDDVAIVDVISGKKGKLSTPKLSVSSKPKATSSGTSETRADEGTGSRGFRFITWNIDGLNEKNLMLRTQAVCNIIRAEGADIVYLQEVIEGSEAFIRNFLSDYLCITGKKNGSYNSDYFTAILMKKQSVSCESHEIIAFESTEMMRNLLRAQVKVCGVTVNLFNTHLESTSNYAKTRTAQLRQSLNLIQKLPKNEAAILAGDLNLRDKELEAIGGLPQGFVDAWIATGRRKECEHTWDMMRNDNLEWTMKYKPRCRFDRIFVRDSSPLKIVPQNFGLIGLQRLKPHVCFPSDHWGLLCHFQTIPA